MRLATLGGAEALRLDAEIGSIEPGKQADLVAFAPGALTAPSDDPVGTLIFTPHAMRVHRVLVEWDEGAMGLTRKEVDAQLMNGDPRISVYRHKQGIMFTLFMNEPGDEKIAVRRMKEIFGARRSA